MNWYLLQIKPKGHGRAFENLQRQGFDVFCPLIVKTTKKNNKFLNRKSPLVPGYLFMGTAVDPVPWNSINGTRGVSRAVSLDGTYRPVNTHIIKGLKCRCDKDDVIQKMSGIIAGDRVKIERGPFSDFICNVEEIADNKRVWILIDLLQKQTKTEISLDDLSKIN
jgi:transcriptional antiterminator RfaH